METIIQETALNLVNKILHRANEGEFTDLDRFAASILEDCKEASVKIVEAMVADLNRKIRQSTDWRAQQHLSMKERERPRRLLTSLGEIEYQRDYYKDTVTGKYVYPVDVCLNVSKYERVGAEVCAQLVRRATEMSYAKSADVVTGNQVSKQTVYNQVKRIPKLGMTASFTQKKVIELHVFADEDHVHLQKPGKKRGKQNQIVPVVTVTEGFEHVSKRRNKTICPHHFVDTNFNGKELWKTVGAYIEHAYNMATIENIFVHGDGGNWIQKGLEEYPATVHIMDKYHFEKDLKAFSRVFPEKKIRQTIHKKVRENEFESAGRYMNELLELAETDAQKEKVQKFGEHLFRFWDEIVECFREGAVGSCTEGQVSHLLSERFSRDPMGWSKGNLGKLSQARIHLKNGGEITGEIFKPDYQPQTYKNFAATNGCSSKPLNWSIFNPTPTSMDTSAATQKLLKIYTSYHNPLEYNSPS